MPPVDADAAASTSFVTVLADANFAKSNNVIINNPAGHVGRGLEMMTRSHTG